MNSRPLFPKLRKGALLASLALAALSFASMVKPAHALEAKMYAVTRWDAGACGGATRDYWDDMADAWYDEITDSGFSLFGLCLSGHCTDHYTRDGRQVNGNMVNSEFADAGVVSWGNDTNHIDDADAAIIAWHGSESGNVYQGAMRVDEAGSGDCTLRRDEMGLGNSDLEFIALSSCQSMDDNQWSSWYKAFKGLHQADGFHGLMWIGSGRVDDYEDFADDAFDEPIADAWVDNLYVHHVSGNDDQCPVAYGVGANSADNWLRMGNERYNFVFSDPTKIGYYGVVYIKGCDPANETVITSDYTK